MSASTPAPQQSADLRDVAGRLVLFGAGKMGSALLDGWLRAGLDPARLSVIEPAPAPALTALAARGIALNPPKPPDDAAAIVIAVKPQSAVAVLPAIAASAGPSTLVVSIMAGRTLRSLAAVLPRAGALVRAMPNTPAAIGRGITVAVAAHATEAQRQLAHRLLAATGSVEWIDDEKHMDAVTAVSGSGPAYVFLLAEALAEAGVAAGLPPAVSRQLAVRTVVGAGRLLAEPGAGPEELRGQVTSPG